MDAWRQPELMRHSARGSGLGTRSEDLSENSKPARHTTIKLQRCQLWPVHCDLAIQRRLAGESCLGVQQTQTHARLRLGSQKHGHLDSTPSSFSDAFDDLLSDHRCQ